MTVTNSSISKLLRSLGYSRNTGSWVDADTALELILGDDHEREDREKIDKAVCDFVGIGTEKERLEK